MSAPTSPVGTPPRTAYTTSEVAKSLGVSRRHVLRLAEDGALGSIRAGRYVLIPVTALEEFVNPSN